MLLHKASEPTRIWFEAESNRECLRCLADSKDLPADPTAEVRFTPRGAQKTIDLSTGCVLSAATHDEELGLFYYLEHEDLEQNVITIESRNGNTFAIHWSGVTADVMGASRDLRTRIDIEGSFELIERTVE